jgi:enhancing lycopene biosynthesis protein 2
MRSHSVVCAPEQAVTTPAYTAAVVLAGCGAMDGAEITEAVSLLVQLSQFGFQVRVFAPDRPHVHTINHLTRTVSGSPRQILEEAARIARGKISPLEELHADDFDVVAFAGGFGVAKNLCNFAFAGSDATLQPDVRRVLVDAQKSGKVLAALCIAPVLLALLAREISLKGVRLTLGNGGAREAVQAVEQWGATHVACSVRQACVDPTNRMVTAPAYMDDMATPADIFASAQALVSGIVQLLNR